MLRKITSVVCLGFLGLPTLVRAEENVATPRPVIIVDAKAPHRTVSPEMYGIFFEEISHAGDGGLYAELVQNRDMEASTIPQGWRVDPNGNVLTPLGWRTRKWFKTDLPGWSFLAEGGGEGSMQLDVNTPLNNRNPHSLRMAVTKTGTRCGVANSGYWGINVQAGEWYDGTFYARTEGNRSVGLVFSLESQDGKRVCARATIPEIGMGGRPQTRGRQFGAARPLAKVHPEPPGPCLRSQLPLGHLAHRAGDHVAGRGFALSPKDLQGPAQWDAARRGPDAGGSQARFPAISGWMCGGGLHPVQSFSLEGLHR